MDIIFKYGPHYYENGDSSFWIQVLIAFLGAFFGFGFALVIYYYQTKKDRIKDAQNKLQEKKNKLEYFNLLLENIISILQNQKGIIEEFIRIQRQNPSKLQTLKRIATNDFKRLGAIDYKGIFESFEQFFEQNNDNWISSYRELNSDLDYLEILSNEINTLNESNYNSFYNQLVHVKGLIEFVSNGLSTLAFGKAHELGDQRWSNEEYVFVDKYIKLYMKLVDDKATVFELEDKFVNPLLNELMKDENKYNFTEEFSTYCQTVRTKLKEFNVELNDYLEGLNGSIKSIDKHLIKIIEVNQEIKKRALTRGYNYWG